MFLSHEIVRDTTILKFVKNVKFVMLSYVCNLMITFTSNCFTVQFLVKIFNNRPGPTLFDYRSLPVNPLKTPALRTGILARQKIIIIIILSQALRVL